MTTYQTPDKHEYPECPTIARYKSPFDSGLDYCYPQPAPLVYTVSLPPIEQQLADDIAQARIEWNWPHVFVTREQSRSINASANVRLCIGQTFKVVAEKPTLFCEGLKAA